MKVPDELSTPEKIRLCNKQSNDSCPRKLIDSGSTQVEQHEYIKKLNEKSEKVNQRGLQKMYVVPRVLP